jgi:hypothetical protein
MKNLNEPRKEREADVVSFQRPANTPSSSSEPLISKRQVDELRTRWTAVQASFVDEPRQAVAEADKLVSSAIRQIGEVFREQHTNLEKQWSSGEEVSTEDLRTAMRNYRAFFDRLLSL